MGELSTSKRPVACAVVIASGSLAGPRDTAPRPQRLVVIDTVRGASWADAPGNVTSVGRQGVIEGGLLEIAHYWGFRCVVSRGGDAP